MYTHPLSLDLPGVSTSSTAGQLLVLLEQLLASLEQLLTGSSPYKPNIFTIFIFIFGL